MTDGARRYVPVAETIETEELEGLCREICREMVPNWDIGAGPRPGPGATARNTQRQGEEQRKDRRDERGRLDRGEGRRRKKKSTQHMNHQVYKR